MPKQSKLPPRDTAGKFVKETPTSNPSPPDSPLDPSIREPEPSSSSSTLSDAIASPNISSTSQSPLVFPKPIRHSIPGSFSPLIDSPAESTVPFSTLVSRGNKFFTSPFKTPPLTRTPESRPPSPASQFRPLIPRTPSAPPSLPSDLSTPSSSVSSSPTVSIVSQISSSIFPINLRASQFLSSRPDPPSTQINLDPASALIESPSSPSSIPPQPVPTQSSSSVTILLAPPSSSSTSAPPPPPAVAPPAIVPPPARMAANPPTGPAAMPSARSHRAPYFSGRVGDPLDEFLLEYEELATNCALNDRQKVETILRYIPHDLRDLWKILDGYTAQDWAIFRQSLERTYERTSAQSRHSKQKLYDFVHYHSQSRMRDEESVIQYYRQFIVFSKPLTENRRITDDDHDSAFWYGFHPNDQDKILSRLIAKFPD
ncbi:hypothetical protein BJY52DRAFT_1200592 [Lactarius psammicola]|nr:hypothetical protein BJY52DRAFT_1200592 [Lactarius psammicola]